MGLLDPSLWSSIIRIMELHALNHRYPQLLMKLHNHGSFVPFGTPYSRLFSAELPTVWNKVVSNMTSFKTAEISHHLVALSGLTLDLIQTKITWKRNKSNKPFYPKNAPPNVQLPRVYDVDSAYSTYSTTHEICLPKLLWFASPTLGKALYEYPTIN